MKKMLNDLLFIFPVMFYYLLEALVVGMIITLLWIFLFRDIYDLHYLQVVAAYWILKMVLFDVFKLISGLQQVGTKMKEEGKEYDPNNNNNNETITP